MGKTRTVLLIAFGIIFVVSFVVFQLGKYGTRYNERRMELGVPLISGNWQRNYSFLRSEINYINPVPDKEKRYHLKKRIQTDWLMNIEKEADYFIIEDKGIAIDAIYEYDNRNWHIRYYDKKNFKTILAYKQFLDTLEKYDIDMKR